MSVSVNLRLSGSKNNALFTVEKDTFPNVNTITTNATYAAEQLALYWAKRQGFYTLTRLSGNTVAFVPLPQFSSESDEIVSLAKSQDLSAVYPSTADASVQAGFRRQRSVWIDYYTRNDTAVQESAFAGAYFPVTLLKPLSRGTISINSTNVLAPPVVDYNTLSDPTDLEILIAALRFNRRMMQTEPMQELEPVEFSPGANVTTDEQLRAVLPSMIQPTFAHPCCTAPMVPKKFGGVVSPELLVYGVEKLSVVDASVMPVIPGGMS